MNRVFLCLAAGHAERFDGTLKHELTARGERLIDRTKRLFGEVTYLLRSNYPCSTCTCDTLLQARDRWGEETIVLYGDVYYSEVTRDVIRNINSDLVFFTDTKDIFALKFGQRWHEALAARLSRAILKRHNSGRLWELYRAILGLPTAAKLPHEQMLCHLIPDETQDFDTPEDLTNFERGISKNHFMKRISASATHSNDPT